MGCLQAPTRQTLKDIMTIRDEIKTYIEAEVRTYLPAGVSLTFLNENKFDIAAIKNPAGSVEYGYASCTEWVYPFEIQMIFSMGERSQYSPQAFRDAIELYKSYIGRLMAQEDEITVNDTDHVILKNIRSFSQSTEDQNYNINFILEYSHYEVY